MFIGHNCSYPNFQEYVSKMVGFQENMIQKVSDHYTHLVNNDKKFGALMEKLGFM